MQQEQRFTGSVDFEIYLYAVEHFNPSRRPFVYHRKPPPKTKPPTLARGRLYNQIINGPSSGQSFSGIVRRVSPSPCRRVQFPVGDFEGIALALVFGCRSLRKLADDRQRVSLFVAGLDNHEHPHEQNQKV